MTTRDRILSPYTRRVDDVQHRLTKLFGVSALILLAVVLGYFIGVFGMYGWFIPAIPVAIMALIALWIAPDVNTNLDRLMVKLFFVFMALALIWPRYLALNAPGLPWISFQRIAMFVLAAISLYSLATSSRLRREFLDILGSQKILARLFLIWVGWQGFMMAVGKFESASRWTNQLFLWYFLFLITAWVMSKPDMPQKLMKLILVAGAITSAVVIPEHMNSKPIWADHIPAFLSIDPAILETIQFGNARLNEYRARSIFTNSLIYAEYVGMLIPFCLLAIFWAKTQWRRLAATALLVLMITAGVLTQSRTAMVALVATFPAFIGLWTWRRYRLTKGDRDLIAPAMLSLYPAAAITLFTAILVLPRLRVKVLGGGAHQASNNAREVQWDMAIPAIIKNPIGYGMGSIDSIIPYRNLAGKFTVDSYPINLLVEFGIPGFLMFVGIFALSIAIGVKIYLNAGTRDEEVAGAAAVGIMAFLLARLVLSTEGGQSLAFCFAGLILGIYYRQKLRVMGEQKREGQSSPPTQAHPQGAIPALMRSA
ncbi:O-antigen ligase family protein [Sandaracinobacter sp. RS1-74]|uniref:O-antigen ligase family protein n=1 Tax=Sandaracinobacteroides sayramensis TaxID=2913411 RepID=UPI001EDC1704|nr:O-antigen ligase family protein [Sandaracinobacteroides sayramensis]MCG2841757.1 O-antigen ligase family protein [Sandaracinobacteroides sayramensis]